MQYLGNEGAVEQNTPVPTYCTCPAVSTTAVLESSRHNLADSQQQISFNSLKTLRYHCDSRAIERCKSCQFCPRISVSPPVRELLQICKELGPGVRTRELSRGSGLQFFFPFLRFPRLPILYSSASHTRPRRHAAPHGWSSIKAQTAGKLWLKTVSEDLNTLSSIARIKSSASPPVAEQSTTYAEREKNANNYYLLPTASSVPAFGQVIINTPY
ncbi:hypothetical protein BKA67DRAFT_165066 [Truncatella angustata]|uniref:Uncharacterized protein n=1 Tax=Truncatella angustata TaxID=152316 RepID=A0A9P8UR02_9PEZI|nr:uncharacterized protein BKA67DRAFT_165066 [Truncatella angustata]KAH6656711.1 hypothetical protein BKA67DRAFT_165066 [Truncatella angustata]